MSFVVGSVLERRLDRPLHQTGSPSICASFDMVEGPGVTRNRAKALAHKGKRVVGLSGVRAPDVAAAARGRTLVDVQVLGKELFLLFSKPPPADAATPRPDGDDGSTAIRVHFGMSGSLFLDDAKPTYANKSLALQLHITPDRASLRFFDATCSIVDAAAARAKVVAGAPRDVCAPGFDAASAVAALAQRGGGGANRMLADSLLDQAVRIMIRELPTGENDERS